MKWQDKNINELTDAELIDAYSKLSDIHRDYTEKTSSEKFLKRVKNNVPAINPVFLQIREEVSAELKKREITP